MPDHDVRPAPLLPDDASRAARRVATFVPALNALLAIWLIVSPWVVPYAPGDARWNPVAAGATAGAIALVRIVRPTRTAALAMGNLLVGAWLIASAFWHASSIDASLNAGVTGVALALVAGYGMTASREAALAEDEAARWARGTWAPDNP